MAGEEFLKFNNGKELRFSNYKEIKKEDLKGANEKTKKLFNIFAGEDRVLQEAEAKSLFNALKSAAGDNKVLEENEISIFTKEKIGEKIDTNIFVNFVNNIFKSEEKSQNQSVQTTQAGTLSQDEQTFLEETACKEIVIDIIDDNLTEAYEILNSQYLGSISGKYDESKDKNDILKTSNVAKVLEYQNAGIEWMNQAKLAPPNGLTRKEYYEGNKERIKDMILTRVLVLDTNTKFKELKDKYSEEELAEIIGDYVETLCSNASMEDLKNIQKNFVSLSGVEEVQALEKVIDHAIEYHTDKHTPMPTGELAGIKLDIQKGMIPEYWNTDEPISFEEVYEIERGTEYSQYKIEKYALAKKEMEIVANAYNKKQQFVEFAEGLRKDETLSSDEKAQKVLEGFAAFYVLSDDGGLTQLKELINKSKLPISIDENGFNFGTLDDSAKNRALNSLLKLAQQSKEAEFEEFLNGKTIEDYQNALAEAQNDAIGEENGKMMTEAMKNDNLTCIQRWTGNTSMVGMGMTVVGGILCFTPLAPLGAGMITVGNTLAIGGMVAETGLGVADYATKDVQTIEEAEQLGKNFLMNAGGFIIGMGAGKAGMKAFSKLIDEKLVAVFGKQIAAGNKAQALKTVFTNPEYLKNFMTAAGAKLSADFVISYAGDLAMMGILDTDDDWQSLLKANITGILVGMSGDIKDVSGAGRARNFGVSDGVKPMTEMDYGQRLLGNDVTVTDPKTGATVEGTVTRLHNTNGQVEIEVNGQRFSTTDVTGVKNWQIKDVKEKAPTQIMKPTEATTFNKKEGITFKPNVNPNDAPSNAYKIEWGKTIGETIELNQKNGVPLELVKDKTTDEYFLGVKHSWDNDYYRVDRNSIIVKYGEGDFAPVAEDKGAHIFTQTYLDAKTGKPIDVSKMKPGEPVQIVKNPNSTVGAVAFEKPTTVNSLEGKMQDVEMVRTDVDGHPYGTYEQLAKDIHKGKLVANEADPNSAKFIELVKAGKDTEAMALLKQASLKPAVSDNSRPTVNPHNITQIATAEEVGAKAIEALAGYKHRIATAGYSVAPKGYETSTREFLKALDEQLGSEQTSFVTSPTADKGSIDAITTEVAGFDKGRIFYTTAQDYVDYINPENFPATIDKASYSTVPKFVLPDAASYSAATAKASNAFIATGGRNATVSDFVNAIKNDNKAVILDNTTLDVPVWDETKGRVENASKYISEQIKAVREGRELPYPEVGEFTRQFLEENIIKIEALMRTYQIDGTPESIKIAAQKSAAFIDSNSLASVPLNAKSPLIQNSKVSMISKPNDVDGIVPDLTAEDKILSNYGLVKDGDKWYAPNREWFPRAITENDIIIIYGRDAYGKPSNIGFCSKSEFSSLYTDRAKYKDGSIEFIDAENLPKGQVVEATKCASGEVCILPVGTKLETNEGIVEVKPGEIVIVNEAKNSVYATNITEILKRYKNDPLNPASKELFNLLNEFAAKESTLSETEKLNYHQKIADSFGRLNRGQKLYELAPDAAKNPPQTLRQEYDLAAKIATDFEAKFLSRIDVSNFNTALAQAKDVLTEIYQDASLTPLQKQAAVTSVMVKLLPKTNAHQHTKGSLPRETAMQLAQKKGYTPEQIAELEAAYRAGEAGFATLTDFNNAYGIIGRLVSTPSDYKIAIDGIIRKAVSEGQLTTEIRCACDSLRDENGRYLSPEEGTKVILDAIEETKAQLRAEGKEVPATGYVFLTYRGKDWDASLSAATIQAKQAVRTAMEHPEMKFGFDIAGPEDSGWGPKAFEESLGIIREYNEKVAKGEVQGQKIGITIHAGETPTFDGGRPGYESVREAIEMGADRIGHGVQAVLDEATMQMMKDAGVTVEICGVCNIQSIPINTEGLAIHPIQQFIDRGIKVSLCTDNDAICGSNITKEYNQFLLTGHSNFMNWNNVKQSARDGIEAAFIPESAKIEARTILEYRINQIQNMLNEVTGQYDGITSIETKMANGRAVRVGVLDVFGKKHKGIAINGVEKDFAHGDLVAGALESYVKNQNVDIVKFPVKVSDPKRYDSDGKLVSSNTKSNLRLDPRSLLKELKKLNSLPEDQKLDYLNLSNSISLEYKVNGREISPSDLANPEIRAEIRASLPKAVEHILQELEILVKNGTEVYISAGNRRNTFSAFSLVEGIHTIGGKNLSTGEPLSYLTNHALVEEHVGLPLYMVGAKGGQKVLEDPNIKGVKMAGIIDQQSPLAKMSKWQLSKKVATNADYAELKKYADEIIAAGKKKIDINFFQYSFAFTLPEKFRYKIYDTQRFIALFEGHLEPEVLEYIKPMGTHCDIQYRQFFDMKAKEGHHVMPMSKTTAVRNTVSGTSFGPAQVIARKIKEGQEK